MTDIRITAGSWAEGAGTYEAGLFRMPNGDLRGVEDVESLDLSDDPAAGAPWRGDLMRGLKGALASTGSALPRPFGLAASVMGAGLGVFAPSGAPTTTLRAAFTDGAHAVIALDTAAAAAILRDREVVRLAILRRDAGRVETPVRPAAEQGPDGSLTSMFEYEKRKGRVRRVAKTPGDAQA